MDKTIKINLAGTLFQIETEAYYLLRDYLNAISNRLKNTPGGYEAIEDIEGRIAELFNSRKGLSGVISSENVRTVIDIIGRPEDFDQSDTAGEFSGEARTGRRLYRDPDNSVISGVCGGIGAYLNTDPVWIRLGFILFSLFFGIGFFIYLGLWIALPAAVDERMKRDLYGPGYYASSGRKADTAPGRNIRNSSKGTSPAARVLNEIFIALGRLLRIMVRIVMIIAGIIFVLTAFSMLVTFIMIFYLRYPGYFFAGTITDSLFYMPDFLNLVISPALTPWVMVLASVVVILPLLALIYWGLKMIFYFRARTLALSVTALVLWVAALSGLVMLLFTQGISFAEQGRVVDQLKVSADSDTLYIRCGRKVADLEYDREISVPGEEYSLYFTSDQRMIFSKPEISFEESEGNFYELEVEKIMHGRTAREAYEKAGALIFNYSILGDTIFIDQYYEIPAGTKWSGSFIDVNIRIPEGKIIRIDREVEKITGNMIFNDSRPRHPGNNLWRLEDGELVEAGSGR
ncbi:MAG TPA: PspC domain-containing protein [Bacteroidales bacterium]|nr:PspC domain-containing protein [Bacteroidales bacterium]HRT89276.1 PspC domain-containing protein [Bacteroidales bacterium]